MNRIEKSLSNLICKTCGNLTYWDGYYCKLGRHQTKKEKLSKRVLSKCVGYIKRQGSNWDSCKDQDCIFWCNECPSYQNRNEI